jgi:hypothetical protein
MNRDDMASGDKVSDFMLHALAGGRHPRRDKGGRRSGRVTVMKVDRDVWREALRLVGNDSSRLRVISADEVLVVNGRSGTAPESH